MYHLASFQFCSILPVIQWLYYRVCQFCSIVFSSNLEGYSHSHHLIAGGIICHRLLQNQLWFDLSELNASLWSHIFYSILLSSWMLVYSFSFLGGKTAVSLDLMQVWQEGNLVRLKNPEIWQPDFSKILQLMFLSIRCLGSQNLQNAGCESFFVLFWFFEGNNLEIV